MSELPSNIHLDPSVDTEGERFERGLETIARFGVMSGAKPFEAISKIAPDFVRYTIEFAYGDIASRPGLDFKTRQAVVIAAQAVLGRAPAALRRNISAGLHLGLSRDEIVEIMMQLAVYAGWPCATEGLIAAREVFDEEDERDGQEAD